MDLKFAEYETKHRELVDEAIKAQFELLDAVETSRVLTEDKLYELKWHEWRRLASKDKPQVQELKCYLD